MRRSETVFAAIVVVAIGAAVAADSFLPRASTPRPGAKRTSPGQLLSSTTYCPVPGPSVAGEGAQSWLSTTNLESVAVHLRRSTIGQGKESAFNDADLAPRRRTEVASSDFGIPDAAGVVESFGAPAATGQLVVSPSGVAAPGCSVGPAGRWLFATGSTARGKDTYLLVANPFGEEARIRVRVMTPNEDSTPSILKDLLVPGQSQATVLMGENFAETESFGMEVTATRGRVIVSRAQRIATRDGLRGLTVVTGARGPSARWFFAGGEVPASGEEQIVLVNPGDREALVKIAFQTESDQAGPPELAQLAVPAGRQVTVGVSKYLAPGTRHGTLVSSVNGETVVAERQTIVAGGGGAGGSLGATRTARRWVVSAGSPLGGAAALALTNFGTMKTVVNVILITADTEIRPPEIAAIPIFPGRRATIDLTAFLGGRSATALIESTPGELVVESRLSLDSPYRDFADTPATPSI